MPEQDVPKMPNDDSNLVKLDNQTLTKDPNAPPPAHIYTYYRVRWESKLNGRRGLGTKMFTKEEADSLVRELNFDYPDIIHSCEGTDEAPAVNQPVPPHGRKI